MGKSYNKCGHLLNVAKRKFTTRHYVQEFKLKSDSKYYSSQTHVFLTRNLFDQSTTTATVTTIDNVIHNSLSICSF